MFYNTYMGDNKKANHNKNSYRILGMRKDFTKGPNLWLRKNF